MRLIITVIGYCLTLLFSQNAGAQTAWCQLKGAVYVDSNPSRVQYRVFIDDSESFADMLVFKASNTLFADRPGLWYFTEARAQAAVSILIVKDRSLADFSIHFVDTESFAGCQSSR
jgi:hypothetical protein